MLIVRMEIIFLIYITDLPENLLNEYMDQENHEENDSIKNQPPIQGNQDSDEYRNEIIEGK